MTLKTIKVEGDKDGRWDLTLTRSGAYDREALVEAKRVDFDLTAGRLQIKAYYPKRVVDCDHWQLRTLDVRIEAVHDLTLLSGQALAGMGYMHSLSAFKEGEEPEIEWPEEGDPLCCAKPHGYVESCFPTKIFDTKPERPTAIPVKFDLRLRKKA